MGMSLAEYATVQVEVTADGEADGTWLVRVDLLRSAPSPAACGRLSHSVRVTVDGKRARLRDPGGLQSEADCAGAWFQAAVDAQPRAIAIADRSTRYAAAAAPVPTDLGATVPANLRAGASFVVTGPDGVPWGLLGASASDDAGTMVATLRWDGAEVRLDDVLQPGPATIEWWGMVEAPATCSGAPCRWIVRPPARHQAVTVAR